MSDDVVVITEESITAIVEETDLIELVDSPPATTTIFAGIGSNGLVPDPGPGDETRVLLASGEWGTLSGEGGAPADAHFVLTQANAGLPNSRLISGESGVVSINIGTAGQAVVEIVDGGVANAKLADVATQTLKGRSTAGTGSPEDLSAAQVRALINVEDGAAADQSAGEVPFTPAGAIAATDVQAAIEELDSEKAATGHSHANFSQDTAGFVPGPTSADITADRLLQADGSWVDPPSGGSGAPTTAEYLVAALDGTLSAERLLSGESGIVTVDYGTAGAAEIQIDAGGVGTAKIADEAVTNAKLAHVATSTLKGRLTASTGDVEDLTAAQGRTLLNVEDGANAYVHPNHTGDVTSSGDGATTIAAGVVTNTKLADVATSTLKGRTTAGTGSPEDLTPAQVRSMINVEDGAAADQSAAEVAFTPAGNIEATDVQAAIEELDSEKLGSIAADSITNTELANMVQATIKGRAAGAGTGDPADLTATQVRTLINVEDGANAYTHPNHTGDVTSVGDGATTIVNDAVTNAKLANVATSTIKGRATASTGDPEDLTPAQVRSMINVEDGAAAPPYGTSDFSDEAVTNAKLAHMAQSTLKGRAVGAGTGDATDLSVAQVKTILDYKLADVDVEAQKSFGAHTMGFTQTSNSSSSGSVTINWGNSNKQTITLTENVTAVTFTDPSNPSSLTLKLVQDATGSRTFNFPSSIRWAGGVEPTLSTAANSIDLVTFYFDGTNYFGSFLLDFATA